MKKSDPQEPREPDRHGAPQTDQAPPSGVPAREVRTPLNRPLAAAIVMDAEGSIVSFDTEAERMFGYAAAEVIGRSVNLLLPLPDPQRHDGSIAGYALRKDGTTFPIHHFVNEVRVGERRLSMSIIQDITEMEEARRRVVRSERLAAVGEMVAALAHESGNALQRTQACLEILRLKLQDHPEVLGIVPDTLQLLAEMQRAQDHLRRLYSEVREYAAPIRLQLKRWDLGILLEETWNLLAPARQGRNAALRQRQSDLDLHCEVDRGCLQQVFRNLLESSMAAGKDPVLIEGTWAAVELDGQPALEVSVWDSGPGFTPEMRQHAFSPFFTTRAKGMGLGMAIALRIIEAHGGCIRIGDDARPGAEVLITLPRKPP